MLQEVREWAANRVTSWEPEEGDAAIYGASALFAGLVAEQTSISLYHVWGELAFGPYLLAALVSLLIGRYHRRRRPVADGPVTPDGSSPAVSASARRWGAAPRSVPQPRRGIARIWVFVFVLAGATLVPLSLEVAWRSDGNQAAHVQPEVSVIDQAAHRVAHGQNPYHAEVRHHHLVSAVPGEPAYESFFPYLPVMTVFGLPSTTHEPVRLTDTRIFFSIATLLVVAGALVMLRAPNERKMRTLQVLTVLPTAALPLATGGDDMPVVAFLLLAMVLAQRRRPGWSGIVLGIVSSMKFTAWPLAALALFAARDKQGRRVPGRMALGMLLVAGPIVIPFLAKNPDAFFQNVILFPLGLAGVASPAASPLPGHLLVSAFPVLHRVLPLALALGGLVVLIRRLLNHPPRSAAEVSALAGWVMLVAILFAPATRVGYLLYPINFFVWAFMLRGADRQDQMAQLLSVTDADRPSVARRGVAA